jgi:hypothetical protein
MIAYCALAVILVFGLSFRAEHQDELKPAKQSWARIVEGNDGQRECARLSVP